MDFRSPEPIIKALQKRVEQGTFGYGSDDPALIATIQNYLQTHQQWTVEKDQIKFFPGLVSALFAVCRIINEGEGIVTQTPIYYPILNAAKASGHILTTANFKATRDGQILKYEIDFDALENAITPQTRLFVFCNPHNPIGRVYTQAELERIAEICLRHDLIICSDEIHCDLILDGTHRSIASLSPEIAARCITLLAPSKTYNVPGLGCSIGVVQNSELAKRLTAVMDGIVPHVNLLGYTAALAAYRDGQPWLDELLVYLRANRDYLVDFVTTHWPEVQVTCPEGTYLSWLDFSALKLTPTPFDFFLNEAKVALSDGTPFGAESTGFLRLNFGCPRSQLEAGLKQMDEALSRQR
jgi:cystathionine beta-lyase